MFKKIIYVFLISFIFSVTTVYADKLRNGGKNKATKEHVKKESKHKYKDNAGEKLDKTEVKDKDKDKDKSGSKEQDDEDKGLDKQHDKKVEQVRKEEAKGSEQGQQSRQEHSRKWWKFWESEEN